MGQRATGGYPDFFYCLKELIVLTLQPHPLHRELIQCRVSSCLLMLWCRQRYSPTLQLTAFGLLTRITLTDWQTSITCSDLRRSMMDKIAQRVPLLPTPSLKEIDRSQWCSLQWTLHLVWLLQFYSLIFKVELFANTTNFQWNQWSEHVPSNSAQCYLLQRSLNISCPFRC